MDERSESIDSPEKLDAYLQVTKPSMWIVFGGVFLFVIAVILWGTLSSINMTIKTEGYILDGQAYFTISGNRVDYIEKGQTIRINGKDSVISSLIYSDEVDDGSGAMDADDESRSVYLTVDTECKDGYCKATINVGSVAPIYFLFH